MNKAVCYIRVGPLETRTAPYRRGDQHELLQQYCREQALDFVLTLEDLKIVASDPLDQRLGGADLIKMIESDGLQHIVTWKLDRLFRDARDACEIISRWHDMGITFHVLDLNGMSIRTDEESGVVMLKTLKVLAEMAHNLPAERTRANIERKKSNRFVYGATPFGYDLSGNQLIPNENEQEIINKVRNWREAGWSLRKIAAELNEMDIPTKKSSGDTSSTKWYASTVNYLLRNPLYYDENTT